MQDKKEKTEKQEKEFLPMTTGTDNDSSLGEKDRIMFSSLKKKEEPR